MRQLNAKTESDDFKCRKRDPFFTALYIAYVAAIDTKCDSHIHLCHIFCFAKMSQTKSEATANIHGKR